MNMSAGNREIYTAPWATQTAEGDLIEQGPSPSTHARRAAEHAQWAWQPPKLASKVSRTPQADTVRSWMRPGGGHLRTGVPKREVEVYVHVYEQGRSVRWTARHMGVHRGTVRVYLKRLIERSLPKGGA